MTYRSRVIRARLAACAVLLTVSVANGCSSDADPGVASLLKEACDLVLPVAPGQVAAFGGSTSNAHDAAATLASRAADLDSSLRPVADDFDQWASYERDGQTSAADHPGFIIDRSMPASVRDAVVRLDTRCR